MTEIKNNIKGTDIIIVDNKKRIMNDLLLECLPQIKSIVMCNSAINYNIKEDCIQELCLEFINIAHFYKDNINIKFITFMICCLKNYLNTYLNKSSVYENRNMSYEELVETGRFDDLYENKNIEYDENTFNIFCDDNKEGEFAKLRYVNGYTLEDIARIKGVSRQAVNVRLNKFKEHYKKEWLSV